MTPPFLLSDVPGDVAIPVAGFGALAITGMAAYVRALVSQILTERKELINALHDLTDTVRELRRDIRSS